MAKTFPIQAMANIPLEDNFTDVLGKAQRGLGLDDPSVAHQAGISLDQLQLAKQGSVDKTVLHSLAQVLHLHSDALIALAYEHYYPEIPEIDGVAQFNTPYHDMMVNAYVLWDPKSLHAAVFDTGTDCGPILKLLKEKELNLQTIFLTHTHGDHIADLARLKNETKAPVKVSQLEPLAEAESFGDLAEFRIGSLRIETHSTTGHSVGGTTFLITGLQRPVAVVGDALFAGSMGGGMVSYQDALKNNRNKILSLPPSTLICPGHGPMTTVEQEKRHNPFFPEFQTSPHSHTP